MAKPRRRSGRHAPAEAQEEQTNEKNSEVTPPNSQGPADAEPERKEEDKCPACKEGETLKDWNDEDKESWVRCDACKKWFHWRCAGDGDLEAIGKWYAPFMLSL